MTKYSYKSLFSNCSIITKRIKNFVIILISIIISLFLLNYFKILPTNLLNNLKLFFESLEIKNIYITIFSSTIMLIIIPLILKSFSFDKIKIYPILFLQNTNDEKKLMYSIPIKNFGHLYSDVKYKLEIGALSPEGNIYYPYSISENKDFLNTRKHLSISKSKNKDFFNYITKTLESGSALSVRVFINAFDNINQVPNIKFLEYNINWKNLYINDSFNINTNKPSLRNKIGLFISFCKDHDSNCSNIKFKTIKRALSFKKEPYYNIDEWKKHSKLNIKEKKELFESIINNLDKTNFKLYLKYETK